MPTWPLTRHFSSFPYSLTPVKQMPSQVLHTLNKAHTALECVLADVIAAEPTTPRFQPANGRGPQRVRRPSTSGAFTAQLCMLARRLHMPLCPRVALLCACLAGWTRGANTVPLCSQASFACGVDDRRARRVPCWRRLPRPRPLGGAGTQVLPGQNGSASGTCVAPKPEGLTRAWLQLPQPAAARTLPFPRMRASELRAGRVVCVLRASHKEKRRSPARWHASSVLAP
jgi:hypothetical protein